MNTNAVPFLKKDAIISIELGAGYIDRLYRLLNFIIEGKSQDDLAKMKSLIDNNQELEGWMFHYVTIHMLLESALKSGIGSGQVDYKELDDLVA